MRRRSAINGKVFVVCVVEVTGRLTYTYLNNYICVSLNGPQRQNLLITTCVAYSKWMDIKRGSCGIISDILINIFTRVLDTVNIKYSLYELTLWT